MRIDPKYRSFYYEGVDEYPDFTIKENEVALLIIDMEHAFISPNSSRAEDLKKAGDFESWTPFYDRIEEVVIPQTQKVLSFFRDNEMRVTYGRIACQTKDGSDRSLCQKREGFNNVFLYKDDPEAQIVPDLSPRDDEIVIDKTTDSVCNGTNYVYLLKNMGIKTVVVAGVMTDQCVSGTVRDLADAGFNVIVAQDCCAAGTEDIHVEALKEINFIYSYVLETDQIIDVIS